MMETLHQGVRQYNKIDADRRMKENFFEQINVFKAMFA